MALLLKRFWWDKMTFDCKSHCQRYIVCNRANPDRRGGVALQPLGIPEYHGKLLVLITSQIFLKVALVVIHPFLLWFVSLRKWLILFHATRRSLRKIQQIYSLIIVIDYMVFLGSLYLIEILSLLGSFGKNLWES